MIESFDLIFCLFKVHDPISVKRSIANLRSYLPDDETEKIDHLVFLVHGIGPTLDFVEAGELFLY